MTYDYFDGYDQMSGGAANNWVDATDVMTEKSSYVSSLTTEYTTDDWTVAIAGGSALSGTGDTIVIANDASDHIDFGDGGQIDFNELAQIYRGLA